MNVKSAALYAHHSFYGLLALIFLLSASGCADRKIAPASELTGGKVTLSWSKVPGAVAYHVYFSRSPGVTPSTGAKIPQVSSPLTITDLEPGKIYYFILSAVDPSGTGRESQEMAYTARAGLWRIDFDNPLAQPQAATGPPSPLQAPAGDLRLAWDPVPGAVSYNVYLSETPGASKTSARKMSSAANSIVIQGLDRGKTYFFVVTAVSDSGESSESEELSVQIN